MVKNVIRPFTILLLIASTLGMNGCGNPNSYDTAVSYALPPVTLAVPKSLHSGTGIVMPLSSKSINEQFFGNGSTSIYVLLNKLDNIISKTNETMENSLNPCLHQFPVSYTITPFGQTVMMYAQCFTQGNGTVANPDLFQFGTKNGIQYIYSADASERMAVILSPIDGSQTNYEVQAWIGLGYDNAGTWDSESYGVMQLKTNSVTKKFELSVAGIGFDHCGLQLISDGENLKVEDSQDMGTVCNTAQRICRRESDINVEGTCTALSFTLPALGRKAISKGTNGAAKDFGDSHYPSTGGNILLTGSSGDDLYFGPMKAISGIGRLEDLTTTNIKKLK